MPTIIREQIWKNFKEKNLETFDVTNLEPIPENNQYLENRLWKAFCEGYNAGMVDEKELLKSVVIENLFK